jgi:uncharacterized damage-inducible protein DinB
MSEVPVWFERKFDLSFPAELYPNIRVRLLGTPARLEELVREQSQEVLIRKPAGKWSAQEHAGHLLDLESLWLARVEDFVRGGEQLTAADLKNKKTHEANHNAHPISEILQQFRSARSALVTRLHGLDVKLFSATMLHPRLKTPMRLVDHLYFAAEHDDHHLALILELIERHNDSATS